MSPLLALTIDLPTITLDWKDITIGVLGLGFIGLVIFICWLADQFTYRG